MTMLSDIPIIAEVNTGKCWFIAMVTVNPFRLGIQNLAPSSKKIVMYHNPLLRAYRVRVVRKTAAAVLNLLMARFAFQLLF